MNQIAQQRFFAHDARVMLDVGDPRHAVGESGEIRRAARSFQFPRAVQRLGEGNQIDGLLAFAECDHLVENPAVLLQKEIFRLQALHGGVERMVVEQNGAQNGAFGVQILRERPFERGGGRHRDSFVFRLFFAL